MVANYAISFIFESNPTNNPSTIRRGAPCGWSETWYNSFGNLDEALRYAVEPANYLAMRRLLLSSIYGCTWIRAVNIENPRESKLIGLAPGLGIGQNSTTPAQVTCALLIDMTKLPVGAGEHAHHRRWLMRGLPANQINGNDFAPTAGYMQDLRAFMVLLAQNEGIRDRAPGRPAPRWAIRYQDPNQARVAPTAITLDATGRIVSLTAPLIALNRGRRVRIQGAKFPSFLNRSWNVLANAGAGGPYSLGRSKKQISGAWDGTGECFVVGSVIGTADQYEVIGLRSRKIGRPFSLYHGRRRGPA